MSNIDQEFKSVESAWGIRLPTRFPELYDDTEWAYSVIELPHGRQFRCPTGLLQCSEIVAAKPVAEDWQIPDGLVPFMGDFHDLLCLDYRLSAEPSVVAIDDDRNERTLFDTIDGFLDAPRIADAPTKVRSQVVSAIFSDEFKAKMEEHPNNKKGT